MLKRFNMVDCRPVTTPAVPGATLPLATKTTADSKDVPFKSAVGSLWWASRGTRPDIEYATNNVAQHASSFVDVHWQAVKRVFRYLRSCPSGVITYFKMKSVSIVAYSDSDWGGDLNNRRSKTGYVVFVAGGAVVWQTKSQKTVALSSCEAEYYAMTEAIKELLWLQGLLKELSITFETPKLKVDNQGAIALAQNPVNHQRTKHIDIKYHFIRQAIAAGQVIVEYVGTDANIADMFTKALAVIIFSKHCAMVVKSPDQEQVVSEQCCLARMKRTAPYPSIYVAKINNVRRSIYLYSHNMSTWRRRALFISRGLSLNSNSITLECQFCSFFIPYDIDLAEWKRNCRQCGQAVDESEGLIFTCYHCQQRIPGDDRMDHVSPISCPNDDCNLVNRNSTD